MAKRNLFELAHALEFFANSSFLSIIKQNEKRAKWPLYYQYRPNGELLRYNFLNEWFIANVAVKEKVSLVSSPQFTETEKKRTSLSSATLQYYPDLWILHDRKLPFGVASSGNCADKSDLTVLGLKRPLEFTECLVQYFVSEKSITDLLHRIEVDHLMWWKQLSNTKEFTPVRLKGNKIVSHIVYSSFHGDTTVESLKITGPHSMLPTSPYIIESKICVDVAMMVLLHDAYCESQLGEQSFQRLQLHQRLAPYKLGIVFEGNRTEELNLVADFIKEELRKETILIQTNYNSSDVKSLQRIGVPYTVLLSDTTLDDGAAYLQDMSTSTKEVVHVTQLTEKIVKYIKSA